MTVFEWIRTKLYVRFKRIFIRNGPVCASQILREPEGIVIILPAQEEELGTLAKSVKKWTRGPRILVISNFMSSGESMMCCGKVVPFSKEFHKLRDALNLHRIDLLIDLNEKPQDRSRMISLASRAKLRVASFTDPPFFNCQIRIGEDSPIRSAELLRTLESLGVRP